MESKYFDRSLFANRGNKGDKMISVMKFGRKLNLPSVVQIKHQLLVLWLKDQVAKEAAEAGACDDKQASS
jgi:hypothetical protein